MAATCPHGCSRCRLIEAGREGNPFTLAELHEMGEVIVPAPVANGWQPDTAEAALAVDVAQAEYDEADRAWSELYLRRTASRGKRRVVEAGMFVVDTGPRRPDDGEPNFPASREIEAAIAAAARERDDAGERLRAARVLHAALTRRDTFVHIGENEHEAAADEEARRVASRSLGQKAIARVRGQ